MTWKEGDIREVTVYITILATISQYQTIHSFIHKPTHNIRGIFCGILSVPHNTVTDLNNAGPKFHPTHKNYNTSQWAKVYSTDTKFHPPTVIMGVKSGHKTDCWARFRLHAKRKAASESTLRRRRSRQWSDATDWSCASQVRFSCCLLLLLLFMCCAAESTIPTITSIDRQSASICIRTLLACRFWCMMTSFNSSTPTVGSELVPLSDCVCVSLSLSLSVRDV